MRFLPFGLFVAAVLLLSMGCSTIRNNTSSVTGIQRAEILEGAMVEKGGFSLHVMPETFEPGGSANFSMDILGSESGTVVSVSGKGAEGLKAAYLDLTYDDTEYSPLKAEKGDLLGNSTLDIAVLDEPGQVHYGQVIENWDSKPGASGSGELARFTFRHEPFEGSRILSAVPVNDGARGYSQLFQQPADLEIIYINKGDYDQNGEVNVADLTPLGFHFGKADEWQLWNVEHVIDGDGNKEINAADITPIGANFGNLMTGVNIYHSTNAAADFPSTPDSPSTIAPIGYLALEEYSGGPPEGRRSHFYELPGPAQVTSVFWTRPTDGLNEGIPSNRSDEPNGYGNQQPLVFITADKTNGDAPLTVNFDLSDSYDPDGTTLFDFYVSGDPGPLSMGSFITPLSASPLIQYTITEPGNYSISGSANDGTNGGSSTKQVISVLDNGDYVPYAVLNVTGDRTGDAPLQLTLDLSGSDDPEGTVLEYEFDISCCSTAVFNPRGDFEIYNGNNPVYVITFNEPGYYEITGRVTDAAKLSNADYVGRFDVTGNGNFVPHVGMQVDKQTGTAPFDVLFIHNEYSTYDEDGWLVSIEIDPEGTQNWQPFDPETGFQHTYTSVGQYNPRMRATDDGGLTGYSCAELIIYAQSP